MRGLSIHAKCMCRLCHRIEEFYFVYVHGLETPCLYIFGHLASDTSAKRYRTARKRWHSEYVRRPVMHAPWLYILRARSTVTYRERERLPSVSLLGRQTKIIPHSRKHMRDSRHTFKEVVHDDTMTPYHCHKNGSQLYTRT